LNEKLLANKKIHLVNQFSTFFPASIAFCPLINLHAKAVDSIAIIPKPLVMQVYAGHFILPIQRLYPQHLQRVMRKQGIQWFIDKIAASTG